MGIRPDTNETVRLAMEILRRIPRNRKVTAQQLQEQLASQKFERTERSIQRQLEMLSEHFGIDCDRRSKPYGYCLKENERGWALPMLTEQESLLLLLAEEHLRGLLPASLMKSMKGFFAQAQSNLGPHANKRREREWLSKVSVVSTAQPLIPAKILPGVFEQVSNALFGNFWLEVDYKNSSGKCKKSRVMPLGLVQQGVSMYLVCRFEGYENERILALHRMATARSQTISFQRPKDFDLQKYEADGNFAFGDGKRIRLVFRIEKRAGFHLLETPLSEDQQVNEIKDQYEISATVVDTARLDWWLRGFGDRVSHVSKSPA